jgi:hypothetical protein
MIHKLVFPSLILFMGLLSGAPAMGQGVVQVKQVVAPASDIVRGVVSLPDPVGLGETSRTLLLEIDPEMADEDGYFEVGFPFFTGDGPARVVFMPEALEGWVGTVLTINEDTQQEFEINTDEIAEHPGVSIRRDPLPWGDPGRTFPAITLPAEIDGLFLRIQMHKRVGGRVNGGAGGYVLIDAAPDRSLYTYVKQHRTIVNEPIALASSLSDGSKIVSLHAIVRAPDGSRQRIEAEVDEQEFSFTPDQPGPYALQVFAEYANADNRPVLLSTQHLIKVEVPRSPLGNAHVIARNGVIEIRFDDAITHDRAILAGEVWGEIDGVMTPICWLARVCDTNRSLELDPALITDAGADPETIELRQVRLHDVDSMVPTEIVGRITLRIDNSIIEDALRSDTTQTPISVRHDHPSDTHRGVLPGGHRLLLVHGYCSGGNPFTTSHFSGDLAAFHDPEASRSHDAFALEILAQTAPMKSFGVAAHSQGAMAALHLSTFYFSGLDWARGDRLIQSVGAPYQGTALAGNAAVLGDVFGFGCGENPDMTYVGSAAWLSLIPTAARQQVWYYTTSFEDRPFAFDFCNIITDLLLDDPDDGVIERSAGQLPGANNMGHVEGWCHTTGMRDPAQCTDQGRNTQINLRARR